MTVPEKKIFDLNLYLNNGGELRIPYRDEFESRISKVEFYKFRGKYVIEVKAELFVIKFDDITEALEKFITYYNPKKNKWYAEQLFIKETEIDYSGEDFLEKLKIWWQEKQRG